MSAIKHAAPAALAALLATAAVAATPPTDPLPSPPLARAGLLPIVLEGDVPGVYPVPDSLARYTASKFDEFSMRPRGGDHCATISGSDSGWDDSDCW